MNYEKLISEEELEKLVINLKQRNVNATVVSDKDEALEVLKGIIPEGASINNGASRTLEEIGFVELLKSGDHSWNNLHEKVLKETDPEKQKMLRNEALFSDFYLGSIHAIAETGQFVVASASGSQLPHIVHTSPNLIFVVGTQKVVPTLEDAMSRLRDHVYPLEDERMKSTGAPGSVLSKIFIFEREPEWSGRNVRIIFVKEKLGF